MFNPEEKDAISFRSNFEKQNNWSEPNNKNSPKEISKEKKLLNPWASYPQLWNKIFLASCVIGVLIDPLFLYIPIINEESKCLTVDENIKCVALILRTAMDISYIFHLIFRFQNALNMAEELNLSIFTRLPWSHLLIDILAVLPLPQIIILKIFAKSAGSRSLRTRGVINSVLFIQYVPRLIRVHLSAKELGRGFDSLAQLVWVRGAFFFSLYIISAHIFGSFWYYYATFRETACWYKACRNLTGCEPADPFDCQWQSPILNITYLNDFCPTDPPNSTVYDFGIFSYAIESKILQKTEFLKKIAPSFWWGLRNLSSFGHNLDTVSADAPENFFAILICISGLLLFLYLIGTLQTYMQLATTNSEEERRKLNTKQPEIESFFSSLNLPAHKKKVIMQYLLRKIKEDKDFNVKHLFALIEEYSGQYKSEDFAALVTKLLDMKKHDRNNLETKAELWMSKNGIGSDTKVKIMRYIRLRLTESKDVDITNLLHILPIELKMSIKKFLCFPILKKVPMLENKDNNMYETMCTYLKPVIYAEKSYIIKKEEPLDFMLFVTQGIVWNFGGTNPMQCLKKGDFYGEELLEWRLNSISDSEFPISDSNLKCHTKVEAFSLRAVDLKHVLSNCWTKFFQSNEAMSKGLMPFAAVSLQQGFRRFIRNKKAKDNNNNQISIVTYK